jgi:hypothetical protein
MDAKIKMEGIHDRLNDLNARLDSYAHNQTLTDCERAKFSDLADKVKRLMWECEIY